MKYIKRFDEYLSQNIGKLKTYYDKMSKADIDFIFTLYSSYDMTHYFNSEIYHKFEKTLLKEMDVDEYIKLFNNVKDEIKKNKHLDENSLTRKYFINSFAEYIISTEYIRPGFESDTNLIMKFKNVVKKQWLVHISESVDEIYDTHFRGYDNIKGLSLTFWVSLNLKVKNGYNFAFTIPDIHDDINQYGEEALIFMASGIRVYHKNDKEYQTIFYGPDATNINKIKKINIDNKDLPIENEYKNIYRDINSKYAYGIPPKKNSGFKGKYLVVKETLKECVDWFTTNYNQYKKYLN